MNRSRSLDRLLRRASAEVNAKLPMPISHVVPVRHDESPAVASRRRKVVAGVSFQVDLGGAARTSRRALAPSGPRVSWSSAAWASAARRSPAR